MTFKLARTSKFFAALFIIFEFPTLFWWFNEITFRSVSSKIFRYFSKNILSV